MPLTPTQVRILAVLRGQRHPGSHVAGSLPLHARPDSQRISRDIDLFHDAQRALHEACASDLSALEAAGFHVRRTEAWSDTFRRAIVSDAADTTGPGGQVEIDWAVDAAWRFFPPVTDELMGWRLHDADLASNKALALAGRSETRDLVDILAWSRIYPLAAIAWAACGKDPGYTPMSLIDHMRRSARIDPGQLAALRFQGIDPVAMKTAWLAEATAAEAAITALADAQPALDIGVLFLDAANRIVWPDPARLLPDQDLRVHAPCLGGCLPVIRVPSP